MDGCVRLGGLEKQEEVRSIYTITSVLCTTCWSPSVRSVPRTTTCVRAFIYNYYIIACGLQVYIYTHTMQEVLLISFFSFTSLLCIFSDDSF